MAESKTTMNFKLRILHSLRLEGDQGHGEDNTLNPEP